MSSQNCREKIERDVSQGARAMLENNKKKDKKIGCWQKCGAI